MKIKVCGMTDLEQVHQLEEAGVEFAGFIFYPASPRHLPNFSIQPQDLKKEKFGLYKVGVFVNASYDEVMKTVEDYGLDMAQLHGHETPYECSRLSDQLHVIKAFRFAENDHVEWMLKDYYDSADMFLFDTGVPVKASGDEHKAYGGTGRKFNWNRLKGLNIGKPFFLSGGIEPADAPLVQEFRKDPVAKDLFVVDLNSRFEVSPGVKDMEKVRRFVGEVANDVNRQS
jgi:phosphoribosylanthranilate isomerase